MPENREEETEAKNADQQASTEQDGKTHAARDETADSGLDLDLEGLDLTVETVEERISPSETNVFDK